MGTDDEGDEPVAWDDWDERPPAANEGGDFLPLLTPSGAAPARYATAYEAVEHDRREHGLDLVALKDALGLGFYGGMRLVNFARREVQAGKPTDAIVAAIKGGGGWLADDAHLIPALEGDMLLQELPGVLGLDMDDDDDFAHDVDGVSEGGAARDALVQENAELKATVAHLQSALAAAGEALGGSSGGVGDAHKSPSDARASTPEGQRRRRVQVDKNYFDSYSYMDIHRDMLSDRSRMDAYRSAIELNSATLVRDKTVLDVGCGTGILSLLCARAGASEVTGVDASATVARVASAVVSENGMDESVRIRDGMIEDAGTLPAGYKCDVIISEWMGYALLYESMLNSVLHARDKHLRPGGCVLPDVAELWIAGCDGGALDYPFWRNVEGFAMTAVAKQKQADTIQVKRCDPKSVITNKTMLRRLDVCEATVDDVRAFSCPFRLASQRPLPEAGVGMGAGAGDGSGTAECHALVLWFDTLFSGRFCEHPVRLTTSPHGHPTHWAQTVLVLPEPVPMAGGGGIEGTVTFGEHGEDHRGLDIVVEYSACSAGGGDAENAKKTTVMYELV